MLVVDRLRKEYGQLVAVNSISFNLEQGDIFGFIGPNGAGKTTTIRILATLHAPTSGAAYVDGVDVETYPEEVRSLIGYMPDYFGVYDDVRTWEYLDFFAASYHIPRSQRTQIIDDVLELTDLAVKKNSYVRELSRGMKQRLCLAKTLVHDPKLLILDEPASGLDPRARYELKELLKELRNMGKTILISSPKSTRLPFSMTPILLQKSRSSGSIIPCRSTEKSMGRSCRRPISRSPYAGAICTIPVPSSRET
jgi:ABC-2 type transport system ATP-binding protein